MAKKTIYARAKPASVKLSESYFLEKKISRNPYIKPPQQPIGNIEIDVPYDGDQYFTRQAYYDVKHQLSNSSTLGNLDAQIGHISFINYDRTNLAEVLDLNNHYGSFPVAVPVLGQGISSIDQLCSDRFKSKITFDYNPHLPDFSPIDVNLELWDE